MARAHGPALLAESHLFSDTKADTLAERKRSRMRARSNFQILDIEGDGREDLLLVNWIIRIHFGSVSKQFRQLGPEIHFTLPPIRSYGADDLDGDRKLRVTWHRNRRAQISNFAQKPAEELLDPWKQGQLRAAFKQDHQGPERCDLG